jgi:hypothetical protein
MTENHDTLETVFDPADRPRHSPIALVSKTVDTDGGATACTVYDPRTYSIDRMSTWITAVGDSFVDCREQC